MSIKVKQNGAWVDIPTGQIQVKSGGVWKAPRRIYVKREGAWVDTGYQGKPNAPATPFVTGWDTSVAQVETSSTPGGVPFTSIRFQLFNQSGGFLAEYTGNHTTASNYLSNYFSVAADTKYIIRAYAVSADGVYSNPSGDLKIWIGHPQQGYTQTDYGWSGYQPWIRPPGWTTVTSEAIPNAADLAIDAAGTNTNYVSAGLVAGLYDVWWEGIRLRTPGGNRWWTKMIVYCSAPHIAWMGVYSNGYLGGATPASMGMALSGTGTRQFIYHNYVSGIDQGVWPKVWNLENYGWNFLNMGNIDLAVTNLHQYPNGKYYAEIADVLLEYRDWVVVGSHFVETVAAQGNQYW